MYADDGLIQDSVSQRLMNFRECRDAIDRVRPAQYSHQADAINRVPTFSLFSSIRIDICDNSALDKVEQKPYSEPKKTDELRRLIWIFLIATSATKPGLS